MITNRNDSDIKMLQFPHLAEDCNIFHFITTRQGGVSQGSYGSFNLGQFSGDKPEYVEENRKRLCHSIGIKTDRLFVPCQIHETGIALLDAAFLSMDSPNRNRYLQGKDALITSMPGLCLAVTTADCVPLLLYDPKEQVVAAVHAGWRGTVKQIVPEVITCMQKEYNTNPANMMAGIGPCIGQRAFEVGEEVVRAFEEAYLLDKSCFYRDSLSGKAHMNLALINKKQLIRSGLIEENICLSSICTYTSHETFFSARRLGVESGRFLTGIFLKQY